MTIRLLHGHLESGYCQYPEDQRTIG